MKLKLSKPELASQDEDEQLDELTLESAVLKDGGVWVGQANQFEQSASSDEFDVIGDVTGFVYFTGGEAECLAIAKEMNDLTITASFEEIAMRAYKPRKKRPMRVKRITPQERIDREKYRRKNRIKLARDRQIYYRKNKREIMRRSKLRDRITRPVVKTDDNFTYTYK